MRVLVRLEGAPPIPTVINTPTIALVGPSIALAEPTMIHIGLYSVPTDARITILVLPQTSRPSSGAQLQSLVIAPSIAPPLFMVPPASSSPAMSTAEQKSFERFVRLAP